MDSYEIMIMHRNLYDIFMRQDYENHYFDVTFYVDGRELYAHYLILAESSRVFKKQLLQNRLNGNGPIQINGYSYDEFFEFIRFFYFITDEDIDLNQTHIPILIELAHIYEAEDIKDLCYRNWEEEGDIFENIALKHRFSLENAISKETFSELIKYDDFINLDKSVITAVVELALKMSEKEDIYKAIYKWGEHQAMITVEMPIEEQKELVLYYIKDFLPLLKLDFKKATYEFMFEFAVPKGLISIDEANEYATIELNITSNGKTITASFIDCYDIFELFQPLKHSQNYIPIYCGEKKIYFDFCYGSKFKRPSTPSNVEKMKGCDWYLLIDRDDAKLYVKHRKMVEKNDYLIAEMKESNENESGDDFSFVHKKITATASRIYTD